MKYVKRADIFDRIEIKGVSNCFITLKNHKGNFFNQSITRLINPEKTKSGELVSRYWRKSTYAYAKN